MVPGYHGLDQDDALLRREADAIGYPVRLKVPLEGTTSFLDVVRGRRDLATLGGFDGLVVVLVRADAATRPVPEHQRQPRRSGARRRTPAAGASRGRRCCRLRGRRSRESPPRAPRGCPQGFAIPRRRGSSPERTQRPPERLQRGTRLRRHRRRGIARPGAAGPPCAWRALRFAPRTAAGCARPRSGTPTRRGSAPRGLTSPARASRAARPARARPAAHSRAEYHPAARRV